MYVHIYVIITRLKSVHFAPTTLPQDTRVSLNWHGVDESGRRINMNLLIYPYIISQIRKCEKKQKHFYSIPMYIKRFRFFRMTFDMSKSNFLPLYLLYAFNINGDHFKICLNSIMTNFCYLSNNVICILKPVGIHGKR